MSKNKQDAPQASLHTGQVVVNYGRHLLLEEQGTLIPALPRGRRIKPVCGDYVQWQAQANGKAVIESVEKRRSILKRHDVRLGSRVLAANVDLLFVVMAAEPEPDLALLDRYIVAGEALDLELQLIFNKADLLDSITKAQWQKTLQPYLDLHYALHWTDARSGSGLHEVRSALKQRCGMLVGPSGAGKSTLIRALVPDHAPRTQALSAASGQGQHTTTATRLYRLPAENGGCIIDSPGVRDFRLWQMTLYELAYCYREFRPLLGHCRFSNCKHLKEPNCAIKNAIDDNRVSARRYANYAQLAQYMENPQGGAL